MKTTILVSALLLALVSFAAPASASPACPNYDSSATQFWLGAGGCVGGTVGLGSDFRCFRGVGSVGAGPAWVSVLADGGCQTGASVDAL